MKKDKRHVFGTDTDPDWPYSDRQALVADLDTDLAK
jgi:hypothetical protein